MPAEWLSTCPFFNSPLWWIVMPLLVAWEAAWKGVALWRAGRNGHLVWFIALLIVNSLGILPIIYIFAFSKKKE